MTPTHQVMGAFHYERHKGDCYIGDTELIAWLLEQFKQGTHLAIYVNEVEPPKGNHIPESERWK